MAPRRVCACVRPSVERSTRSRRGKDSRWTSSPVKQTGKERRARRMEKRGSEDARQQRREDRGRRECGREGGVEEYSFYLYISVVCARLRIGPRGRQGGDRDPGAVEFPCFKRVATAGPRRHQRHQLPGTEYKTTVESRPCRRAPPPSRGHCGPARPPAATPANSDSTEHSVPSPCPPQTTRATSPALIAMSHRPARLDPSKKQPPLGHWPAPPYSSPAALGPTQRPPPAAHRCTARPKTEKRPDSCGCIEGGTLFHALWRFAHTPWPTKCRPTHRCHPTASLRGESPGCRFPKQNLTLLLLLRLVRPWCQVMLQAMLNVRSDGV